VALDFDFISPMIGLDWNIVAEKAPTGNEQRKPPEDAEEN
jgi:hypothetical protein